MDKERVLKAIIAFFENEHQVVGLAARTNYEAATHEENKAENKYDTRGLEASYMAASQGKRAMELQQTLAIYRSLKLRAFDEDSEIGMTALIQLKDGHEQMYYFLGPRGGGAQIHCEEGTFTIITAAAPLGRKLLGSMVGDKVQGAPGRSWEIQSIQ